MRFNLFELNLWNEDAFWVTFFEIEWKDQDRSFLHIERNNGVWKFQFLWLKNKCWCI
jgi:hypothetical protein